jgi:predicted enzyme related to lactoylglutathione lyase
MANPVMWWEIQVDDVEKARAFYGEVFGWSFEMPMGPTYAIAIADGEMVGGLDGNKSGGASDGRTTRIYVAVADMEAVLAKVQSNGGNVVQTRTLITEEFGWYAIVTDPSGVTVGLSTPNPQA